VAVLIVVLAALASGVFDGLLPRDARPLCETGGTITECGQVAGIVLSVSGPSLGQVDAFSLRTPYGEVLEFEVQRLELAGGGKAGPHLREHQVDGTPIEVEYKIDGGRLVALRYTDAD
jgi:hypothetical protein